ncbi:MAG: dihydroorotate dehydrogenase [archaeon GB-1867-005]|nr:dihydroorotate dehydrogenase [Candidatus Culexmicrobium cathedralense]
MASADLTVKIASLKLRNPLILASGVLGNTGAILRRVAEAGAGAVTTKSIGLKPRKGYANPTIVEVDCGFINAMGLPNPGVDEFIEELKIAKEGGVPVIASVFGSSPKEYAEVAHKLEDAGADAIELNLSCPHAGGLIHFSQNPKKAYEVVKEVKSTVRIPVFAKLTAEVPSIAEVGLAVEKAGADGVTAINTLRAMVIDIELGLPVLANAFGGLSGRAIKPIAVRCVYELYEKLSIPIIGVGGVLTSEDVIEFLMAGASAVQVGSAIAIKDLSIFKELTEGLKSFMMRKGYERISEIAGLAHRR